jgi:prepilin-type N-terminal cleavage/methylation domain-containing protein
MRQTARQLAFSVVELIVVLAIIAILASMAIPRFASATTRQRADAAARRIVADLTLAQQRARHTSRSQSVIFDVAAGSYQIPGLSDPDHPDEGYEVQLGAEPYLATIVAADIDGTTQVTFNGFGRPLSVKQADGTITIQVGSETRTITIDIETGQASFE